MTAPPLGDGSERPAPAAGEELCAAGEPTTRASPVVELRLIAGLIGVSLVNGLNLNTIPLITGAWIDELHLGPARAGVVLTEQILIASAVAIILSTQLHRLAARTAGVLAGLVVLAANVWLAFADAVWALAAACALVGLGTGCLQACAAATVASARRVGRTAAFLQVGLTVLVAGLTLPLAQAAQAGGRRWLFLAQAGVVAAACLLTMAIPTRARRTTDDRSPPLLHGLFSPVVVASVVLQIGTMGIWAFTERIGLRAGLTTKGVGEVLAGSTLVAIGGGLLAAWVARPGWERLWAIVGVIAFGASTSLLASSASSEVFVAAMYAQAFTYVFLMPFLTAVAVTLDRTGGLAAAAQGWSALLGAASPTLAGVLITGGSFGTLALFAIAASIVAVITLALIRRTKPAADWPGVTPPA